MINRKEILITGGTGSLGKALVKLLKSDFTPRGIRIYNRSELHQAQMLTWMKDNGISTDGVAFLLGDVRDKDRLSLACQGVDIIINCAAMKRVDAAENDPLECIKTNVGGAENVIYAAIENSVEKVFHISTDKAAYPTTLYGATKKAAEDLMIQANVYSKGANIPRFSCARYGNVFGSAGSVIHTFREQSAKPPVPTDGYEEPVLTITDQRMTRFWITLDKVAQFIIARICDMLGGEIFIPNMPSMSIADIAKTVAPDCRFKIIGIRGQEKLHECLLTEEESPYTKQVLVDNTDLPAGITKEGKLKYYPKVAHFTIDRKLAVISSERWSFTSDKNQWRLTRDELRKMLGEL